MNTRLLVAIGLLASLGLLGEKFRDADPVMESPKPVPVGKPAKKKLGDFGDFFLHSFRRPGEKQRSENPIPAKNVNTLGEVPDGPWYRNRHGRRPMPVEELMRGPGNDRPPSLDSPWKIVSAKSEGVTPGFMIQDGRKKKYLVKFDPPSNPEMTSAADVIVAKFFHALGYHVPENYIVKFARQQVTLGDKVEFVDPYGRRRAMTDRDLDEMLARVPRGRDGSYRGMASLLLDGEPLGPFEFHGVRSDDPNDNVPHEHRRELRGLFVFAAWLGHHDAKSLNSLDTLVEQDGLRYVKHHLLDFGSALGSASTTAKGPRAGNEYLVDCKPAMTRLLTLGLSVPRWARADYPDLPAVGRFESKMFDPEKWKPNYPNPAFRNRLPEDTFWAARQVMAFDDDHIRALVGAGEFSDPRSAEWLTGALIERRDKIGKTYLTKLLPLDRFAVRDGRLEFEDLAVRHRFAAPRQYQVRWFQFDNNTERKTPLPGRTLALPDLSDGEYAAAEIRCDDSARTVVVYLRKRNGAVELAGVDVGRA